MIGRGTMLVAAAVAFTSAPVFATIERASDRPIAFRDSNSRGIMPIRHTPPRAADAIKSDAEHLAALGYAGSACSCSCDGYVSRESNWAPFVAYVKALKVRGLKAWLYDERGYPSGFADGLTLDGHPELQAMGYLVATNGESFRIAPIFEGTHAQVKLSKDRRPYPNILMREATERFLAVNHQRYVEHLGENLGEYFVSTFTDEPSLMSHWLKPMEEYVLPYAPKLPALYRACTGRELEGDIKTLVLPDGSAQSKKVRYDFWNLVGEQLSENFFGAIDAWCRAHGILSGGHLMSEELFADHVGFYGDFLACLKRMSAPGIDMLTIRPSRIARTTPLFAASARALTGAREAMVEISDHSERMAKPAPLPWTIAEANGAVNLYIWGGITAFPSYLAIQRMKFPDEIVRNFNQRTGRLVEWFSRRGEFAAETAIVYPAADLKANYRPLLYRGGSDEIDAISRVFRHVEESLYTHRRPCLIVDEDFLLKASVKEGRLSSGALSFSSVILPNVSTLPGSAWRKLAELKRSGGLVMAVGRWPENDTAAFPSTEVSKIADELFCRPEGESVCGISRTVGGNGAGVFLPESCARLAGRILDAFFTPVIDAPACSPIRVQHRRTADGDLFFIFNDSPSSVRQSLRLCGDPTGFRIYLPDRGECFPGCLDREKRMEIPFKPYDSLVIETFGRCNPQRLPAPRKIDLSGRKDELAREPYETSRNLKLSSNPGQDAFHAIGTLEVSNADTFHWVNYDYKKTPFATDATAMLIFFMGTDPAHNGASPWVSVFLKQENGRAYIAHSAAQILGSEMKAIVLSPKDFRPFRHSDPLDATTVTGIAVGYGGWRKGRAGDHIGFAVRQPQFIEP